MTQKEMINFISEIEGVPPRRAANHYVWFVRQQKLSDLKRRGRTVHAQPTTTIRTAIAT